MLIRIQQGHSVGCTSTARVHRSSASRAAPPSCSLHAAEASSACTYPRHHSQGLSTRWGVGGETPRNHERQNVGHPR
jgi:hypothetical protein